ncbi:M23 family metallopeptidase [Ehrlichia ruminantium]|uniref:Similar to lipoprotein nlpD n=1 Tax=Ehrlichia ruminantium (strain Welgevonden) TaxID=254945 RepID=A0A0H3LZS9_EHRRW|nr:peptidase [Ehrlichia ruminantium]CAI27173.1 Similar to lipoprotein nlpD precursor [Ehrlichia ruminantium str. Welgevonden]QLK50727.1 M23 family metallopeptidase [Ehrlichia ruminantium]QLK51650.1 M23 family metallopeptidase [Ehrlichia ruminantium]QLK52576.1 M23 family metallopeptidase [Ehrlichia ruminantium]
MYVTIRKAILIMFLCFGCTQKPAPYFLKGEEFHGNKELESADEYHLVRYDIQNQETNQPEKTLQAHKITKASSPTKQECIFIIPIEGIITSKFLTNNQDQHCTKGIIIKSNNEQPVRASAAGKILYTGHGLKQNDNTIIIEHNRNTITLYSYLSTINVKVGDKVKQGEPIGSITTQDNNIAYLCFSMRKHGKSVNPLSYINCKSLE